MAVVVPTIGLISFGVGCFSCGFAWGCVLAARQGRK